LHPVFDRAIFEAAARDQEVELTTFGRKSGRASRRIIWIMVISDRLYLRSGLGMTRDWPKNLVANGRGMLHMAGQDLPVTARHITDPQEARLLNAQLATSVAGTEFSAERTSSVGDQPLTPAEQAVFELLPA
jgi:deazaflavin-dependent oxidoreductase (nitroreductase family)